jgi:hypothetical protein
MGGGVHVGGGSWSDGRDVTGGVASGDVDDRSSGMPLYDDRRCRGVRWSRWIRGQSKSWRNPAVLPWCTGRSSASTTSFTLATISPVCCFACCGLGAGGVVLV